MAEGFEVPAGTVVLETAVDMEGLERDMKRGVRPRAERIGEESGSAFGEGFGKGADAMEAAGEALEDVGKGADKAGGKVSDAKHAVESMTEEAGTAEKATGGLAAVLIGSLSKGATRAFTKITHLTELGIMALGSATSDVGKKMQRASQDMKHFDDTTRVAGKTVETTGDAVHGLSQALHTLKLVLTVGTIGTMVKAIDVASDFEETFNKIETAIPKTGESLTVLRSKLSALSSDTGIAAETINETYFKTITRMPRLQNDAAKALELTRTAAEAEATGFTTATQAIETYEAVLQGFQLDAENAEEISSKLFKTQELAGVTFDKIAQNIGDVAATSEALGGEFEDLLAIYATLVPTGQSVSEVTTQMQGVIQGLIKPTGQYAKAAERMGVEMGASAVRSKGLLTVIEDILEVTEGRPEAIAQLFGRREARTALIALADRLETLKQRHNEVSDAQGEHAETFQEMNQQVGKLGGRIKQDLLDALRQFGFGLREGMGFPAIWTLKQIRNLTAGLADWADRAVQNIDRVDEAVESAGGLMSLLTVEGMGAFGAAMQRQREIGGGEEAEPVPFPQGPEPGGEIERPGIPLSAEFHRRGIEAEETRRKVEAFREFLETGNEEAYQRRLDAIQRKVNQLVEERVRLMKQHGAEAEEIQKLIELYDTSVGRIDILSDEFAGLEESVRRVAEEMGAMPDDSILPEGFEDEGELRAAAEDMESTVGRLHGRLQQLREEGASQEQIYREMSAAMAEADVSMEDLQDSSLGLARILVRDLGSMFPIWAGWAEGAEDASDETEGLKGELQEVASLAQGVLNVVDAMGELDRQTRQTLRGVVDLANSLEQTAKEGESGFLGTGLTTGGFMGAVGAGVSILSGIFGGSQAEQEYKEHLQDLNEALRELENSVEAVKNALGDLTGREIAEVREFFNSLQSRIEQGFQAFELEGVEGGFAVGTAGGFFAEMERMGLSFRDLERVAEATGIEIDALRTAFEGGEARIADMEAEMRKLQDAVQQLQIDRLTESFAGQLDMLEQRFEIMDIEDSADQLERLRELFLEFTDLPEEMERALAGADLSTAEGRRQFESVVQQLFEMIASGEIEPEQLGDLTVDQFRDMLSKMEGLTDDLDEAGAEGETTGFQQVSRIQEVTADQMLGTLTTISFIADQQLTVQRAILAALDPDADLGNVAGGVASRAGVGGGGELSVTIKDLIVESPPLPGDVDSPAAARRYGRAQGQGVAEGISERLADEHLDFEQSQGRRTTSGGS